MTTLAAPITIEREFTVRSRSQFQHAVRRFVRNPLAMSGLVVFVAMMLAAFAGPRLFSYGFAQQSATLSAPPGTDGHAFGTDTLGRDVLLLTLRGIQWSVLMAAVFVVVAVALGVLVGALSGYVGGSSPAAARQSPMEIRSRKRSAATSSVGSPVRACSRRPVCPIPSTPSHSETRHRAGPA